VCGRETARTRRDPGPVARSRCREDWNGQRWNPFSGSICNDDVPALYGVLRLTTSLSLFVKRDGDAGGSIGRPLCSFLKSKDMEEKIQIFAREGRFCRYSKNATW
jgi:hypothetical protein